MEKPAAFRSILQMHTCHRYQYLGLLAQHFEGLRCPSLGLTGVDGAGGTRGGAQEAGTRIPQPQRARQGVAQHRALGPTGQVSGAAREPPLAAGPLSHCGPHDRRAREPAEHRGGPQRHRAGGAALHTGAWRRMLL